MQAAGRPLTARPVSPVHGLARARDAGLRLVCLARRPTAACPGRPAGSLRSPAFAQERPEPAERPRIYHVFFGEPAALRRTHTEADVGQVQRRMRVAVDRELHTMPTGPEDVLVPQIEPVGE